MAPDEEDFAALLAEYDDPKKKRREPKPGDEVKGRVISIGRDAVFVDLGAKSDGMLELAELRDDEGKVTVKVGDELEARVVEGGDGVIMLRRAFGRGKAAEEGLAQAFEHGIPVEGLVSGVNKGGVEVQVAGVRAFCPISQLDLRHTEDASAHVGQRYQFRITRFEPGPRGNIVLSRRALLEAEQAVQAEKTRAQLAVGSVVRGKVTALKDYGAFVDLGGLEGMLHVSEIGFSRIGHPKDVLSVGQEIEVAILKIEKTGDEKRPEKIALSLKSLEKDPWSDVGERVPEGAKLPGIVVRVETFGAFVEILPGVEGLVHASELGTTRQVRHARDVVKVGQAVQVTVLTVDAAQRRISLSMALQDDGDGGTTPAPAAPKSLGTFGDLLKKKK
jgi:small subunit ribosomal protein S1